MNNRFQILSLDGGGIKGIFTAAVLAKLEEDLNTQITKHFDLIVGTSTGGIIALGLGIGMRPIDILNFYLDNASNIFPTSKLNSAVRYFRYKYDSNPLIKALKDCFGDLLLGDSKKRLVIPSYNLGEDDVYIFKTPHNERLKRDYKTPIWKVALATASAPTYFSTFKGIDNVRLIDGGVWANNPINVGISEAISLLDRSLEDLYCLSIGTTNEISARPRNLDFGGLWQWRFQGLDIILRAQSIGAHTQAQHLLSRDKVIRLNPVVPDKLFKLDDSSPDDLISKAAHESRIFSPVFENIFLEHNASDYIPYHKVDGE